MSKSEDSEIPLYDGIKQTTKVSITESRRPQEDIHSSWLDERKDNVGHAV